MVWRALSLAALPSPESEPVAEVNRSRRIESFTGIRSDGREQSGQTGGCGASQHCIVARKFEVSAKALTMDTPNGGDLSPEERSLVPAGAGGGYVPPPPPPPEDDEEDEGMLRMSFLEHLEEMRSRIIRALMGFGVAFLLCMIFCYPVVGFCAGSGGGCADQDRRETAEPGDQ